MYKLVKRKALSAKKLTILEQFDATDMGRTMQVPSSRMKAEGRQKTATM